jgi:hypothetical protein
MEDGRLIRVEKYRGDAKAVAYIVAVANPAKAIDLIRKKAADPADDVQDLGRVSAALLKGLDLPVGEFVRADGRRGASRDEKMGR